jgi:hypothetical protein
MDLPILAVAAVGLAAFTMHDDLRTSAPSKAEGPAALVGQTLYASEDPIPRWGEVVTAEDLALEDLGRVAEVRTSPEGQPEGIVVAVGGLWGVGAREVEMGMERVHLVQASDGSDRLVVDLSANGAVPVEG